MSAGTEQAVSLLEKQIQAHRRISYRGVRWLEEKKKYATDETAMEIVNSYSRFVMPQRSRDLHDRDRAMKREDTQQLTYSETGQLVVYDSHAKVTTQANEPLSSPVIPTRKLTQSQKRDLKHLSAFGTP